MGFPANLAHKESACNAGDPGSIPGPGRCPGEGIGHWFQYSWASLVAQIVKNLPAMRETWVQSLGWEDPLEEDMQPTTVFLSGESLWTEEPGGLQSMGSQRVGHDWATKHSTAQIAERWFRAIKEMNSANGETVPIYKCCQQKGHSIYTDNTTMGQICRINGESSWISLPLSSLWTISCHHQWSVLQGRQMHFHISRSKIKLDKENK